MPKTVERYATSAAETAGQVERGVTPGFQLTYDSGTWGRTGARTASRVSAIGDIFDSQRGERGRRIVGDLYQG